MFGDTLKSKISETEPFTPLSVYALSKRLVHFIFVNISKKFII